MQNAADFSERLQQVATAVSSLLDELIPESSGPEQDLMRAMRHAALAPGKRMRPFLLLETGALFDAPKATALRAAAALECVHTYSLVHDDLPCMDDDELRRGQPTVHVAFDEATAVLAGDALLTLAFEILSDRETSSDPALRCELVSALARASGALGMVGGQMIDMLQSGSPRDLHTITRMQRMKTGALISHAVEAGALIGGASAKERRALLAFAQDLGLAYQIADDLLDATGDTAALGKGAGKDEAAGKTNFVTVLGVDGARERVDLLAQQTRGHLAQFGGKASLLLQSVDFVLARNH